MSAPSTSRRWKPGSDLPYVLPTDDAFLAIRLPAAWLKADPSGQPLLLPPAIRAVDRLRAVFEADKPLTPGFIVSLREAMGLTQEQFADKLGVSKMTISRWECGRMRPGQSMIGHIHRLQRRAQREGVSIDGRKR
jgi:hypothetical protein